MYRSLGRGLFELLALLRPRQELRSVEGLGAIERALSGRRAVIATAHTGNWDLVACAVAQQTPLTVVTKRLSMRGLDRVWHQLRTARGVQLLSDGIAQGAATALRRGRHVAMMIDQAPERRRGVILVEFLGKPAEVDLAPALVAMRARRPLVVAFPRRSLSGHELHLAGVLEPPDRPNRAWATFAMTQATRWLEERVRTEPEQWLWMHRRWKRTPKRAALSV
jgi:KDO2-lipid IV(A) lauroyltransferase